MNPIAPKAGKIASGIRRLLHKPAPLASVNRTIPAVLGSTFPLPGLNELSSCMKSMLHILQTSSFETARCSGLAFKIRSLDHMVNDITELESDYANELASEMIEINQEFERASSQRCPSFLSTSEQIELADWLDKRIDTMLTIIPAMLQVRASLRDELNQLDVIKPHDIQNQTVVPDEWNRVDRRLVSNGTTWTINLKDTAYSRSLSRHGRVGRVPVLYTTYVADRAVDAEKLVREMVDLHLRFQHPNIATVFGVTKGMKLNGVVLTSAALPIDEFQKRPQATRAVLQCVTDLCIVDIYLEELAYKYKRRSYSERLYVQPDGHLTVTLSMDYRKADLNSALYEWSKFDARGATPIKTIAKALYWNLDMRQTGPILQFLDLLMLNASQLTELCIMKLANVSDLIPVPKLRCWTAPGPPPFTVHRGEIGVFQECNTRRRIIAGWQTLGHEDMTFNSSNHSELTPDDWMTVALWKSGNRSWFLFEMDSLTLSNTSWNELVGCWSQRVQKLPEVNLDNLALCTAFNYLHEVSQCDGLPPVPQVYLHRRPKAFLNPKDFWGYFSSSNDPENQDCYLRGEDWKIQYGIDFFFIPFSNDWNRKRKKLLRKGLKQMPGSFPEEAEDEPEDEPEDESEDEEEVD